MVQGLPDPGASGASGRVEQGSFLQRWRGDSTSQAAPGHRSFWSSSKRSAQSWSPRWRPWKSSATRRQRPRTSNLAQRYQQVGNTLRKRDLLGFLANRNVLPKYGFPVDSVELRTNFGYGKDAGANLDLTRDLSQAIYEYAPDATIVAGGRLWTSRGIYRLPGRDLVEYHYQVCKRCGGFRHGIEQRRARLFPLR